MAASLSNKRRRKRKRADNDGDPEFQVAPMVDVLLVLLLFFMAITSTEVLKKNKNLQLPDAKDATPDKDHQHKHEIIVNIAWDGLNSAAQFSLDDTNATQASDLTPVIAARVKLDPASCVVIRADKDVQYVNVSDLMNACASAGIGTVRFAVITGGGNNQHGHAASAPVGAAAN